MTPKTFVNCNGVTSALPPVRSRVGRNVPAAIAKLPPTPVGLIAFATRVPSFRVKPFVFVFATFSVIVPLVLAETFRMNAPLVGAAGNAALKTKFPVPFKASDWFTVAVPVHAMPPLTLFTVSPVPGRVLLMVQLLAPA